MANFELKRLPLKAGRQLKALADGGLLDRKENLLAFGNPGAGKSSSVSDQNVRKIAYAICVLER